MITFFTEFLYHFSCGRCKGWWTVKANDGPPTEQQICPYCRTKQAVEEIRPRNDILERLSQLEYNWDGEGALPISAKVLERAKHFLDENQLEVVPNTNGTVTIEYNTKYGFVHIEIGEESNSIFAGGIEKY